MYITADICRMDPLQVIAHQGDAMDPELAAIERELFTEKEDVSNGEGQERTTAAE